MPRAASPGGVRLFYRPEALKAILMVSARNDITKGLEPGDPRLSLKDGAGGISASLANAVVSLPRKWGGIDYTCNSPLSIDLETIHLPAGANARVAIAWATSPADQRYLDEPSADLDLVVLGPNDFSMWSSSWDNTYEMVQFVAPALGNYRIVARRFGNCTTSPRRLGWAWLAYAG